MKIIDILNNITRIKDGSKEMIPSKIRYDNVIWEYCKEDEDYFDGNKLLFTEYLALDLLKCLNDEVEIIEENKDIEEIEIEEDSHAGNFYIRNENGTKCYLTKHSMIIIDKLNETIRKVKQIENK